VLTSTIFCWACEGLAEYDLNSAGRARIKRELRNKGRTARTTCSGLRSYFNFAIRFIGRRAGDLRGSLQKCFRTETAFSRHRQNLFVDAKTLSKTSKPRYRLL
jgi:hypothetical protein